MGSNFVSLWIIEIVSNISRIVYRCYPTSFPPSNATHKALFSSSTAHTGLPSSNTTHPVCFHIITSFIIHSFIQSFIHSINNSKESTWRFRGLPVVKRSMSTTAVMMIIINILNNQQPIPRTIIIMTTHFMILPNNNNTAATYIINNTTMSIHICSGMNVCYTGWNIVRGLQCPWPWPCS